MLAGTKKETLFVGTIRGRTELMTSALFEEYKRLYPGQRESLLLDMAKNTPAKPVQVPVVMPILTDMASSMV